MTHATGLFKHGEYYYYYDPNDDGVHRSTSTAEIANRIITSGLMADPSSIIKFVVYGFDNKSYLRPSPKEFILKNKMLDQINNKEIAFKVAAEAIKSGCLESLQLLWAQGLVLDMTDKNGFTLLAAAIAAKKSAMALELLNNGADPNQVFMNNLTALTYALVIGRAEIAKLLIDKGADVNKKVQDGYPPIYYAINYPDMVTTLLKKGANPNQTFWDRIKYTEKGEHLTLLNELASTEQEYNEVIKILLADPRTIVDWANELDGKTALMLAAEKAHTKIVKLLVNAGADVHKKDKNGKTALMLAHEKGRVSSDLEKLLSYDLCRGAAAQTKIKYEL